MDPRTDPKMPAMPGNLSLLRGANLILASTLSASSERELGEICLAVVQELTDSELGFIGESVSGGQLRLIAFDEAGWGHCSIGQSPNHRVSGQEFPGAGLLAEVVAGTSPLLTNDPAHHPASAGLPDGHPVLTSFLGAPMFRSGEVVGLVAVANRDGGYDAEDASTLEAIVPSIVAALYAARAERAQEWELARVRLLREVASIGAGTLDSCDLCEQTLQACVELLGMKSGGVHVADEAGESLVACAALGMPEDARDRLGVIALQDGSGTALAFRENRVVTHESPDVPAEVHAREAALGLSSQRLIALPMRARQMPLGVLTMSFEGRRPFEPSEMELFQALADQLAVGVEKGRSFSREHSHRLHEAALREVAQVSLESLRQPELTRRLTRVIADLLGARQARIRVINHDGTALLPAAAVDPSGYLQSKGDMPVDAENETAACLRSGRPVYLEQIGAGVSEVSRHNAEQGQIRSCAIMPLVVEDRPIGTFFIGWDAPRHFSADDKEFLEALTTQCSVGLHNARLYEAEKHSATINRAMSKVSEVLAASLDVEAALPSVLAIFAELVGAQGAMMVYEEGGQFCVRQAWGKHATIAGQLFEREQMPYVVSLFADGRPVFVADVSAPPGVEGSVVELLPQQSAPGHCGATGAIAAQPMIVRGAVVGALVFTFPEPMRFGPDFKGLAARVSYLVSSAMESARLYQTEHGIAETLQEMLVTVPDSVPGLAFSRAYQSATSEAGRVGGDFVDVFEVREGLSAVSLGDVSGKGMAAATLTSLVRNTIRAYTLEGLAASEVCQKTNAVLRRFTEVDTYVTLFFALITTETGLVRYVSAGHLPSLVMQTGGGSEELHGSNSPILGAFDDARYYDAQAVLSPGERLVMYTDGVTEARAPGSMNFFGVSGLKLSLARHTDASVTDLAGLVIADVLEHSDGVLRDDAALLIVEPEVRRDM